MFYSTSAAGCKSSEITLRSTGTGPAGWREYWRRQSEIDQTDWISLHRQLVDAWRRLRSLAEASS
jgi:hypothetical protein